MGRCRYEQITCDGPGSHPLSLCQDGCRGPVDLSLKETKPAKKIEEVTPVPKGSLAPVGICPTCGAKDQKLKSGKLSATPICRKCYKRLANAAYNPPKGKAGAAKAAAAPKAAAATPSKAAPMIAKPRPMPAPGSVFAPLTARSLADALEAEVVVLRVTCRTVAATLAVVRAAECDGDVFVVVS